MANHPTLRLNDGRRMPQMGAGIWLVPADDTARVVGDALAAGYRLIDGAAAYQNEQGLGQAIRETDIPREDIFVTTKLWNDAQGYDAALRGFDASIGRLGLDYVDLYLIHWPVPSRDLYVETWKALIRLREEGRARSIGVANFHQAHLDRLIAETGVTPALNQIELHPSLPQVALRAHNDRLGIVTQSWTPLGRGHLFAAPEVVAIAGRLGATPAQVILRWHVQNGLSVIPKSERPERLRENLAALDLVLSDEDMAALNALDSGHRTGPDPDTFAMM
ncbi:MAG: aldo/keto reductase [Paracoccus sp. (in: a-proteobacteria)]|uniref:aldo/keto reductase n=1 Tax=Paracoccus sp. TaxID=267 RepID=UPI0026DF7E9B|nr:aldo/keto reductase [Paracoccus sp. (in: a-proteobacteria)]MDO5614021.1 aldo/keto reductase [Paracoccus sp. (in: a-proteobacteria)]